MKKNIIPITDLRKTNEISQLVKSSSPVFITKNGYSDMVIMSDDYYERFCSSPASEKENHSPLSHLYMEKCKQEHCHGLIHIGLCSLPVAIGNVDKNIALMKEKIDEAIRDQLAILAFPELSICGYTSGDLLIQSALHDSIKAGIADLLKYTEGKEILVFVGAPIVFEDALYNCAIAIQNGKILGIVPKKYIPNYKEYYEGRYFEDYKRENSHIHYLGQDIPFGTKIVFQNNRYLNEIVSVEICEDAWAPHSPSLDHAMAGATVIFNLSASNETLGKQDTRRFLVREASRKLDCIYCYCSSSCDESTTDLLFSGASLIAESGDLIAETPLFYPSFLKATVDISRVKNRRRYLTTYVADQRDGFLYVHYSAHRAIPDALLKRKLSKDPFVYADFSLTPVNFDQILEMQALGLARRMKAIRCRNVVLGLSGGLDSTLALLVAHRAYEIMNEDKKGIICITLPCFGTSERTYENALKLAERLGNTLLEIDISSAVMQHLKDIDHLDHNYDITYENAQARERTKILMDYANKVNGIVIGTGDLSEIALGWSTYNGDHISMYAVNASIPKTLIRAMFTYLSETRYKELADILKDIRDTPISPELIPGKEKRIEQKTEDIIGPYQLHDFFLYHYMNENFSFRKIFYLARHVYRNIYDKETIRTWLKVFIRRFYTNQFKRSCMPDGIKVTSVSLSPRGDLRLPSDVSYQSFIDDLDQDAEI